jgi:hypothetical protein
VNTNPWVLVWAATALVTTIITFINHKLAQREYHRLRNGVILTMVAKSEIRREALRLIVAVLYLTAGFLALFPSLGLGPLIAPLLVAGSIAIAANSFADLLDRRRLIKMARRPRSARCCPS